MEDVNDGLVVGDISDYQPADITAQLVDSEAGRRIDLMLGGGRASWLPRNQTEADTRRVRGRELNWSGFCVLSFFAGFGLYLF